MTTSSTSERARGGGRALRLLAAILLPALMAGAPASAQEEGGVEEAPLPTEAQWAVQPSSPDGPGNRAWFTYTLKPGQVFGDIVAVSNLSDRPVRFLLYATDAHSVPDDGGFAPLKEGDTPTGVGSWIELGAREYVVQPGTRIDVPFAVRVPDDAEPGDHAGAIIAVDADDAVTQPAGDGVGFNVRQRIGARVYVRVDGPLAPALRIDQLDVDHSMGAGPFGGGRATIEWKVTNTGNTRLTPTAELEIAGILGRTVRSTEPQQLPELLPGGTLVRTVVVDDLPSFERMGARLTLSADGVEVTRVERFWAIHWMVIAAVLLAVLFLVLWLRRRRSRRRPAGGGTAAHRPRPAPTPTAREKEPVGA